MQEKDYLSTLNSSQREAVEQLDGPVMIIAGAGSGKTRVLTYRVVHLLNSGIDAFNILALTFTNKAAKEMKRRIAEATGENEAKNLWMGTFHAICVRLLRVDADKLGYPKNFTIYDTIDSQRLLSSIIKEQDLDKNTYRYKEILSRISKFKNNLITVKTYYESSELMEADAMRNQPRMGDIYRLYVNRCFKAGAMDFDDLLLRTNELLTRFPEVLMKYQNKFRYIMVDEYQDTNHSQYLLIKALADRFQNICVVGDDSQSIYAFRGANINNIFNFKNDFQGANVFRLEQNYRSTKNIVNAANSIIENNKNRLEKKVWTHNDNGTPIKIHRSMTDADEGRFVAQSILNHNSEDNINFDEFAVLYRTNSQSRALEDALRKKNISYYIYGGLSFYQRKEIKDVLSYLRLILNTNDEEAFMRVINYPARGIGMTTINKLIVIANEYNKSIFDIISNIEKLNLPIAKSTQKHLKDFAIMIQSFQITNQNTDAFNISEIVFKKSGLLQELKKDTTFEGITRKENVEELMNGIKDFVKEQKQIEGTTGSLEEFLEDVALATDLDKKKKEKNSVSLMTIHLSKGLEFPYVYIVGLEEKLFPSFRSLNSREELEEERRLFYVALTRAEKQAYLTYAESRYQWGNLNSTEPSRFINEISEEYITHLTPAYKYKSVINKNIFGEINKDKLRQTKPLNKIREKGNFIDNPNLRKYKPNTKQPIPKDSALYLHLEKGYIIEHERFGRGVIKNIEGKGNDKKINVKFENSGTKNLLLRFVKFKVISQ